jgi:hypothetical protein
MARKTQQQLAVEAAHKGYMRLCDKRTKMDARHISQRQSLSEQQEMERVLMEQEVDRAKRYVDELRGDLPATPDS